VRARLLNRVPDKPLSGAASDDGCAGHDACHFLMVGFYIFLRGTTGKVVDLLPV
jgi:hypothetical protein